LAGLAFAGWIPIPPSLAVVPHTRVALAVPGLYILALFVVPLLFRPRKLPYALSYEKLENE